ncbi:MAG: hypothetical protein A2020_16460 [Lentisphaerae bacterium GWF2_45_14]|nr:MAG: hypothetical protein A2020_16460 [Lentisphaerae bacterium GWF2_45_14]
MSNHSEGGIGIGGVLLITFIILKLCKVIDWSWWWVLSPLWIPLVVFVAAMIIVTILVAIKEAFWR